MKFKFFYLNIILRITLIILLTFLTTHLLNEGVKMPFVLLVGFLVLVLAISTLFYVNRINRWVAFFLKGIENEDTSLRIPGKTGNRTIDTIFEGMEHLNNIFKQANININAQEQYYKKAISQSATGLFSVNRQGRITSVNEVARDLTNLEYYHHINTLRRISNLLPEFIMNTEIDRKDISATFLKDKKQMLLFKLSEISTNSECAKLVAVSDITRELDHREVDAWIKLGRTLSHEIMNNIAPITTLSKVIGNYYKKNGESLKPDELSQKIIDNTVKGLEVVEERSSGLMRFVQSYREFTRLPEPVFSEIKLFEFVEKSLLICSGYEGFQTVQISTNISPEISCKADENMLAQVVINLIKNALEMFPEISNESNNRIKIGASKMNNQVFLDISNNGPQIQADVASQIFIPFFTTKKNGSGIGLSLSKQFMLKMDGDIILKTNSDGWIGFRLTL